MMYTLFQAAFYFTPLLVSCLFYLAKFGWLIILRRDRDFFYDPKPMRWFFAMSFLAASFGSMALEYAGAEDPPGVITLFMIVLWGYLLFTWRNQMVVFETTPILGK